VEIGVDCAYGNIGGVEMAVRSFLASVPDDRIALRLLCLIGDRSGTVVGRMAIVNRAPILQYPETQIDANGGEDFLLHRCRSCAAVCQAACQIEPNYRRADPIRSKPGVTLNTA
jgi:hypothetical protein